MSRLYLTRWGQCDHLRTQQDELNELTASLQMNEMYGKDTKFGDSTFARQLRCPTG